MKKNRGYGELVFIIIFALVAWFIYGLYNYTATYDAKCRQEGGVVVSYHGSINCAKEGYIDIHV